MDDGLSLVVEDPEDEGERADVVLGRRVPTLSRRIARRMGHEGRLFVDGVQQPPSVRVRKGQRLELRVASRPTAPGVHVLEKTDRVVYVAKPAGMHTHALRPDDPPALADAVVAAHPECADASIHAREHGAIHRLDRETSGVVAFARDRETWQHARDGWEGVHKLYVAIATAPPGSPWPPAEGRAAPSVDWRVPAPALAAVRIATPLARGHDGRVVVHAVGRRAATTVAAYTIAHDDARAIGLFLLLLHTGARHQARVHMASIGWPLLGDARYGGAAAEALMLHAARLDLGGVIADEPPVEAPWPEAFHRAANLAGIVPAAAPGLLPPARA